MHRLGRRGSIQISAVLLLFQLKIHKIYWELATRRGGGMTTGLTRTMTRTQVSAKKQIHQPHPSPLGHSSHRYFNLWHFLQKKCPIVSFWGRFAPQLQSRDTVTAYFSSKQLLHFGFAKQRNWMTCALVYAANTWSHKGDKTSLFIGIVMCEIV